MRRSSSSKTQRSRSSRLWYWVLYHICRMLAILFFRVRCEGRQHEPLEGGVLVISNHQSNFDPVIIHLGPPIEADQIAAMTDEELVAESERRVRFCHQAARQGRRRALRLA